MTVPPSASYVYNGNHYLTSIAAAPNGGFWVQVDGTTGGGASRTLAIGGAPQFANVPERGSIVADQGWVGCWLVSDLDRLHTLPSDPGLTIDTTHGVRRKSFLRSHGSPVWDSIGVRVYDFAVLCPYYAGLKQNTHHEIRVFFTTTAGAKADNTIADCLRNRRRDGEILPCSKLRANQ
jgi:hypothetical protein